MDSSKFLIVAHLVAIMVIDTVLYASQGLARFVLCAVPIILSSVLMGLLIWKHRRRVDAAAEAAAAAIAAQAAAAAAATADARARGYVFQAPTVDPPTPPVATPSRAPTRVEIFWFVLCVTLFIITLIDCLRIALIWQSLQGFSLCPFVVAAALLTSIGIEYMGDWAGF